MTHARRLYPDTDAPTATPSGHYFRRIRPYDREVALIRLCLTCRCRSGEDPTQQILAGYMTGDLARRLGGELQLSAPAPRVAFPVLPPIYCCPLPRHGRTTWHSCAPCCCSTASIVRSCAPERNPRMPPSSYAPVSGNRFQEVAYGQQAELCPGPYPRWPMKRIAGPASINRQREDVLPWLPEYRQRGRSR